MPKAFNSHHHWYSSIVDSLKSTNPTNVISDHDHHDCRFSPSLVHVYDNALHGLEVAYKMSVSKNSARGVAGHGSHAASTAAGNIVRGASYFGYAERTARGVAPRARLAVYKFAWEEGSLASDDLAAAIKGVVVSTSAGNAGGEFYTLHNGIPWVLTSAASNIDRSFVGIITLGDNITIKGWTMFPANAIVENQLIYEENISACNSATLLSKFQQVGVVFCDKMGSVSDQIRAITESRVVGAILVSEEPQFLELGGVTCQCVLISPKDARTVLKCVKNDSDNQIPSVRMRFQGTTNRQEGC
ncbi:hypothetical protein L484_006456 [Morus notabilis]|uniref:Peptidase S8/S53 domain-containing protein n=1 Tax=Morus notabilis TaxID=981085 RepID=W9S239_9ROSA|nr:hypothetical protein L484_006456 [Morus notabilis]